MTKVKNLLFGLMVIGMGAIFSLAYAQTPSSSDLSEPMKEHAEKHIKEIYNQLNLTDDQKSKLEDNKEKHRAEMQKMRQEMRILKESIKKELMNTALDMNKINDLHGQYKVLLAQSEDAKLASILEVRAILTPDQFAKFVSFMHQHKQDHN